MKIRLVLHAVSYICTLPFSYTSGGIEPVCHRRAYPLSNLLEIRDRLQGDLHDTI